MRGPSASCGRGPFSPVLGQGCCQESASVVHAAAEANTCELLITYLTTLHSPRRHHTTSHSSTAASPLQLRRCSHRERAHPILLDKDCLDPGTSRNLALPRLEDTHRRPPAIFRTRDTNTTPTITRERLLQAAFPQKISCRSAHHDFFTTPHQYRQSVFHSPPTGRHLVRRECKPVAAQLRPVRREEDERGGSREEEAQKE